MLAEIIDDVEAELGRWVATRDSGRRHEAERKAAGKLRALG